MIQPHSIPIGVAVLGLATVLLAETQSTLAADAKVADFRLRRISSGVRIDVQRGAADHGFWRIDGASNMRDWFSKGRIEVRNGEGSLELPLTELELKHCFYRMVPDNSVANVLRLPRKPFNYANVELPDHLKTVAVSETDNTPADNPITDAGATLGRVLFYDRNLSTNRTISCASCHRQRDGFSDPRRLSVGFAGGRTGRNSMGLANARFYQPGKFFWDHRAATLEEQVLMPIQDSVEMGMDLNTLTNRLQQYEYYQTLFTTAFGDSQVTSGRIAKALAQFIRSMVSFRSRFDEGMASDFANFTESEKLGRQLFNDPANACAICHAGPNLVGSRAANNGLEFPLVDAGVGGASGVVADEGQFKMSSLRNVEKTAPYMHDGRFATLEEVVDFYSDGVVDHPGLPGLFRGDDGNVHRPDFTADEKAALVAFMKTFTDHDFLADRKFSNPFPSRVSARVPRP